MATRWHIITGEYPPDPGGVAAYSRLVARGLADAGDSVCVWAPARASDALHDPGVDLRPLPGNFGPRALTVLTRSLHSNPAAHALVQYVPHAFGFKAMNLPLCVWLCAQRRVAYSVMFHEVAYPLQWKQSPKHNLLAIVQRAMAAMVARRAVRIFFAAPSQAALLKKIAARRTLEWLPVPSNIPVVDNPVATNDIRRRYAPDNLPLIGHFGTYGATVAPLLDGLLPKILAASDCHVLLTGANSDQFLTRWSAAHPAVVNRVFATGRCSPESLSLAIGACDLMVQPFSDGVSTRRGTVMAALAHARPVVSTRGINTEPLWDAQRAIALAPCDDLDAIVVAIQRLLADHDSRLAYAVGGRELYARQFDLTHTIDALRRPVLRSDSVARPELAGPASA